MKRYDEIMEELVVTDEMRSRILSHVDDEPRRTLHFSRAAIRLLAAAACLALMLTGWLALRPSPEITRPPVATPPPGVVGAIPQVETYESAEALSQAVGFTVILPQSLPFVPENMTFQARSGRLAEIVCTAPGQRLILRKSPGTEDNSGVFSEFPEKAPLSQPSLSGELMGKDGAVELAVWTDGTSAYSLSLSPGVDKDAALKLVEEFTGE